MYIFLAGAILLASIIGLFWLKDELESPMLARIAYSEITARLALAGAAISVIGLLIMLGEFMERWSG